MAPQRSTSDPSPAVDELQPEEEHVAPEQWVTPFAEGWESRRLDALQADLDLLDRLMLAGYQGPEWEEFCRLLAAYGFAVCRSWLRRGLMFERCREKGYGFRRSQPAPVLGDDAIELASETVALSLVKYRDTVIIPRRWRPDGGASIQSFFVGQMLLRFPNVYRRWRREVGRLATPIDEEVLGIIEIRGAWTVTRQAEAAVVIQDLLARVPDPITREVLCLAALGYRQREIAARLGLSVSAVKSRLARFRKALRDQEARDAIA